MHRLKKIVCMILCTTLFFSGVQTVHAAGTEEIKEYDIYPIVRDISYDGTEFTMDDQVNVVYEEGIDDATKSYLEEVLSENGVTSTVVKEAVDGEWNVLLGIDGSEEAADTYEDTVVLKKSDLYDEYDGYLLETKDKQITIVGADSDAVFRGVATLKMMLSSFEGNTLLGAQIEDYAGMEYRGFIEGFYGGWDYETRESLMNFARDVKMNMYVYASKTDTYHTSRWNELYPDEEIQKIKELVKIGQETKCYYVWSVHLGSFFSGLNITNNPALYEQRYEQLEAKLTQLYNAGVRKFDILNDDFGSGSHADVVTVLNRLNEEFIEAKGCEPITYCPQGYNKSWSGDGSELNALRELDDSIILYWTGDDVNSPITQDTVNYVAEKTGQPVSFWLNYPVNEHAHSGMFLGNITHYARDGVTGLKAAVSNPSRFGQSNKVALFQLASLFWNNREYSSYADEIWTNAFQYLEPEVTDEYLTIARNTANCPNSSRVTAGFPESEYIKENLEAIISKVNTGESIKNTEDAATLQAEFANILNAIESFNEKCSNTALVAELEPWLNSLTDVTTACDSILQSMIALEAGDISGAWSEFAAASKALQSWDTYPTYSGSEKNALAGSKRLQPFAEKMITYVKATLTPLLDSNYTDFTPTLYAKLGGAVKNHDTNAAKIFDGDTTTYAQWNVIQQQDDYFGVDLGRVMKVTDISILQANSDTHHDYFHKAVLEYSEDGVNFTQLGEQYNDTVKIEVDGLDIQARYVRLRLVETGTDSKADYWTHVREFTVNKEAPDGNRIYTNVEAYRQQPLTISGKEYSVSDLSEVILKAGEYIGMKFVDLSSVSAFAKEGTGLDGVTLEISDNGTKWTEITDLTQPQILKYVRLVNKTDAAITFELEKLGVTVENTKADPAFFETNLTNGLQEGTWENVFDGEPSTYAWTNESQAAGDYIIFDLGSVISMYDVSIITADGNPRLYNAEIQISTDKVNWETIAAVVNDNSVFEVPYRYVNANANGADARYLRIYITGNTGYYLKLNEIIINASVDSAEGTDEITATFGGDAKNAIDGNLSTLFTGTASDSDYIEYKFTETTRLKALSILQDPNHGNDTSRLFGPTRYETGYKVADALKAKLGVKKFKTAIVATGNGFADALSGSYLAAVKEAPILLTSGGKKNVAILHDYISRNVEEGGTVYILGGTEAVPKNVEAIRDEGYTVKRLYGNTRYDTNLAILEEAGITGTELIVATGKTFADSLSVSALKKPILLVKPKGKLTEGQKAIAEKVKGGNIYIIGGTDAVSDTYKGALEAYGTVERVFGDSRYDTSVEVAKTFFGEEVEEIVVASGKNRNYPDGLCGGPLAAVMDVPLILTADGKTEAAANYVKEAGIQTGTVLGGTGAIEEKTVETIFKHESTVVVKILTDHGYEIIGRLNESANTFELDETKDVYALRIEFEKETEISIYEIYLDAIVDTDDIGEYVEPIIKEVEIPDPETRPETSNIAAGKTITVSGTSDGNKDYVNDGDTSTKWDSNFIKGSNASENSWIYIDLGNDKTSIFNAMEISYFNKIYPTVMEIQISNDGENWITVNELTSEHNGAIYPVVTEIYEPALTARYVRLFFEELNSAAAGNGVGITEWEITGVSLSNLTVKAVRDFEDVNVDLNTSADMLDLPKFVTVTLTHTTLGDYEVKVPVTWNTDTYNSTVADVYTIEGTLELPKSLNNTENMKAVLNVSVGDVVSSEIEK